MGTKKVSAVKKAASENTKKSVTPVVVYDVLCGKYGAPEERNAKLKAAGYSPSVVTKKINELTKLAEQIKPLTDRAGGYYGCLRVLLEK